MLNFSNLAPFSVKCSTPLDDDNNDGTTTVTDAIATTTYCLPGNVTVVLEYPVNSLTNLIQHYGIYRITMGNEHASVSYELRGAMRDDYPKWVLAEAHVPHAVKDTISAENVKGDARDIKVWHDRSRWDGFYRFTLTRD